MVINIFDLTDTHRIDESQLFSSNKYKNLSNWLYNDKAKYKKFLKTESKYKFSDHNEIKVEISNKSKILRNSKKAWKKERK